MRRLALVLILAAAVAGVTATRLCRAAERPTAPDVAPGTTVVDTEPWARTLALYLTPDRKVDYAALRGSADNRRALSHWLADQAQVSVSNLSRDARMAFWINLYNAATVELILRHYPIESILELGLVPGRAWKWEWIRADGRLLSLDAIEHEILRAEFKDPRIHFALNCASTSCPPLRRSPYRASTLDEQLETATREFLASPSGLRVRPAGSEVVATVSKIFDWFREDFESERGGVVGFLSRYAPPETADLLRGARGRVDVRYSDYDWSLNAPPLPEGAEATSG